MIATLRCSTHSQEAQILTDTLQTVSSGLVVLPVHDVYIVVIYDVKVLVKQEQE